jgi:hypothetical protein
VVLKHDKLPARVYEIFGVYFNKALTDLHF